MISNRWFLAKQLGGPMSRELLIWGQKWKTSRETLRGWFHLVFGIIGWILLHFVGIPRWMGYTLLVLVAGPIVFLDWLRVQMARALRDKNRGTRITTLRRWRLEALESALKLYQKLLALLWSWFGSKYKKQDLRDWFEPKHRWVLRHWHRGEEEQYKLATAFPFAAGMLLVYFFNPDCLVALAILFQGVADPTAKWIGIRTRFIVFPWPAWVKGKTLGGMGAGFAACVLASFVVLTFDLAITPLFPETISIPTRLAIVWAGCAAAPIAELLGGRWDNFWVPVISAGAMRMALHCAA